MIGCTVYRVSQDAPAARVLYALQHLDMDIILFAKWEGMPSLKEFKLRGVKTVCWVFDLYWGYMRQNRLLDAPYFRVDYVFTTDGGNDNRFQGLGINHQCVRQGIYKPECYRVPERNPKGVCFVGSDNTANIERTAALMAVKQHHKEQFRWIGRTDTHEMRGTALNDLYATVKVVIGDSVYSPHYWSNRVVETLGRGGFLIHQDTSGLSTEYPHLVTYPKGDYTALNRLIDYYLTHETERRAIVKKNFAWVKGRYTMDRKCAELLAKL